MKISSVEEMRTMDETAMSVYGIPSEILMENAGQAVVNIIKNCVGICGVKFLVFCGAGNNGGDGFVVARKLHSSGGLVRVYLFAAPENYTGAAKLNYEIISRLPVPISQINTIEAVLSDLQNSDVVIDAIFGIGLSRDVSGVYQETIEVINKSEKTIFSVDIPSGINGDNGQIMGTAILADRTITFGLPKMGNLLYPGYAHCGKLCCSHISFPPELYTSKMLLVETNPNPDLPTRDPSGHKGDFGDLLCVAGSANYYGAPYFAAYSFLKAGGGYSRLAAPKSIVPFVACKSNEIVYYPLEETGIGCISRENFDKLDSLVDLVDMVVLGSGVSVDDEIMDVVGILATRINKPLLIDGDGITAISCNHKVIRTRSEPTILTPHIGEMARLTGLSISAIKVDPFTVLRNSSRDLNAIIVLKGAHSLIGLPDGRIYINLSGNSGMATAGSGDVLTGTIAAMYGLGLSIEQAVCKGVFIHGLAGDLAAAAKGEDGITAQDILDYLPYALKQDRSALPENLAERYIIPVTI